MSCHFLQYSRETAVLYYSSVSSMAHFLISWKFICMVSKVTHWQQHLSYLIQKLIAVLLMVSTKKQQYKRIHTVQKVHLFNLQINIFINNSYCKYISTFATFLFILIDYTIHWHACPIDLCQYSIILKLLEPICYTWNNRILSTNFRARI